MDNHIELLKADITRLQVDCIVNAANSSLRGGGGVDGAIHRAAGPLLLKECISITEKIGSLPTGEAVITKGYNLPATYVIHTVGPVWNGGKYNEDALLANAYRNSLNLAMANSIKTIAFPNISTGIYGFPKERAAQIAFNEVHDFLRDGLLFEKVFFVCFDLENFEIYSKLVQK
jgi:O-acetyl-ADP-ribose deacetylase (regulator of RNase III)